MLGRDMGVKFRWNSTIRRIPIDGEEKSSWIYDSNSRKDVFAIEWLIIQEISQTN
jgi:hypothetical protein